MNNSKIIFINFTTNSSASSKHVNRSDTSNTRVSETPLGKRVSDFISKNAYPYTENLGIFKAIERAMESILSNYTINIDINNITTTNFMNFVKYIFTLAFEYNIKLYNDMLMIRIPPQLIYVQMQQLFYGIINMYFLSKLNQDAFNNMLNINDGDTLTVNDKNKRLLALLVAPLFNSYAITTYYYMLYKLVGFKGYNVYITNTQYSRDLLRTAFNENETYESFVDLEPTQLNMLQYFSYIMYNLSMNNLLNPNNNDVNIAKYIELISLAGCYNISETKHINAKLVLLHSVINTYTPYNYYNNINQLRKYSIQSNIMYDQTYIVNKLIDNKILTKKTYDKTTHNEIFFKYLFEKINETYKPMYERVYYSILYYSCYNTNLRFSLIKLDECIKSLYSINDQYINNINKITEAILDNNLSKTNDNILYIYKSERTPYKDFELPDTSIIYDDIFTNIFDVHKIYNKIKIKQNNQRDYNEYIMCLLGILNNKTSSINIDYLINI